MHDGVRAQVLLIVDKHCNVNRSYCMCAKKCSWRQKILIETDNWYYLACIRNYLLLDFQFARFINRTTHILDNIDILLSPLYLFLCRNKKDISKSMLPKHLMINCLHLSMKVKNKPMPIALHLLFAFKLEIKR